MNARIPIDNVLFRTITLNPFFVIRLSAIIDIDSSSSSLIRSNVDKKFHKSSPKILHVQNLFLKNYRNIFIPTYLVIGLHISLFLNEKKKTKQNISYCEEISIGSSSRCKGILELHVYRCSNTFSCKWPTSTTFTSSLISYNHFVEVSNGPIRVILFFIERRLKINENQEITNETTTQSRKKMIIRNTETSSCEVHPQCFTVGRSLINLKVLKSE